MVWRILVKYACVRGNWAEPTPFAPPPPPFARPEDVEKALEVSKDKLFFGCKIEVTSHEGLDGEDNEFRPLEAELDEYHPKATRTLFIGNLEKDITTSELRKHFDQFGDIIEIDIKKQGSASSYAFIQYADIASVVKAMRKLDGENLGANRIKLGFGKSMPTMCVWLDGLTDLVSDKFLSRTFGRYGPVSFAAIDRERGHALVYFDSLECAQHAVAEMRGRVLGGKKLQVPAPLPSFPACPAMGKRNPPHIGCSWH